LAGMERASPRRLAVVSAHLAAAAAANGPWRPGQRFRLTEDRKLLARLCVRENVHRIDAAGSYRIVVRSKHTRALVCVRACR